MRLTRRQSFSTQPCHLKPPTPSVHRTSSQWIVASGHTAPSSSSPASHFHAPAQFYSHDIDFSLVATFAQHLTSTAISAGFLKVSNPRWLDPASRKLEALSARQSSQEKRDRQASVVSLDSKPVDKASSSTMDRNADNDGRGVYFTCVPLFSHPLACWH